MLSHVMLAKKNNASSQEIMFIMFTHIKSWRTVAQVSYWADVISFQHNSQYCGCLSTTYLVKHLSLCSVVFNVNIM